MKRAILLAAVALTTTLAAQNTEPVDTAAIQKIRDEGPKGVQAQIQGDQLRVSAKKKDDLQAVITMLKQADFGIALQFTNYR